MAETDSSFDNKTDPVSREMLQAKLLANLFANSARKEIVVKGGMALRAGFDSMRYTKDIDLAADPVLSPRAVRARVEAAIQKTLASGLLNEARVAPGKQTDTTMRWKINGKMDGRPVHLTVEVSRRDTIPTYITEQRTWTPPAEAGTALFYLDVLTKDALAATKVSCLLSNNREAPRDIFDLHLLIGMGVDHAPDLLARLDLTNLEERVQQVWTNINKMEWSIARAELEPFLPEAMRSRVDEELWEEMRLNVGDCVEKWLRTVASEKAKDKPRLADIVKTRMDQLHRRAGGGPDLEGRSGSEVSEDDPRP